MGNDLLIKELESKFKCARCGVCCTNDFLRIVTFNESGPLIAYIRDHSYLRNEVHFDKLVDVPLSYSMNAGESCPFYDYGLNECMVYDIRPECCRKFPIQSFVNGRGSLECSMSCVGFFTAVANVLEVPAYCKEIK